MESVEVERRCTENSPQMTVKTRSTYKNSEWPRGSPPARPLRSLHLSMNPSRSLVERVNWSAVRRGLFGVSAEQRAFRVAPTFWRFCAVNAADRRAR